MFPDKLRNLFRGSGPAGQPLNPQAPGSGGNTRKGREKDVELTRQSRGLEQFFTNIKGQTGLTLLDLTAASQDNISFITNLGHRIYSEDFRGILQEVFAEPEDMSNPGRIDYFLRQTMDYPEEHFDGVLVWDVLEYMSPALLSATLERLHKVVRPGSYLLAFFHSDDKVAEVPYYAFRIQDMGKLLVTQSGHRKPAQTFNNRSLEKLFSKFESVKFFLTRENLREVIIRR